MKWSVDTLADSHSDVILHLRGPGAGVEQVVVTTLVHHPGSLGHQSLLQQVVQAALEDLHGGSSEEHTARMQLSDVDD